MATTCTIGSSKYKNLKLKKKGEKKRISNTLKGVTARGYYIGLRLG